MNKIEAIKISSNKGGIQINVLKYGDKEKIILINLKNIDLISIGVFSCDTKTTIVKLYLLIFLVTFISTLKETIFSLDNVDKKLHIDIYKSFIYPPFVKYFDFLSRKIFIRQKVKLKNIFYKNYYLIELTSDKILFSFQSLFNMDSIGSKNQMKIDNKDNIWAEILFHCHILKNKYINNYGTNFNSMDYQNYYAFFELKSTYPRRTFFIKFLPALTGLALIHEYVQIRLASFEGNEEIHYKECESIYGYKKENKGQDEKNNSNISLILMSENNILKEINLFFIESFYFDFQFPGLFYGKNLDNLFISKDIIGIINYQMTNFDFPKNKIENLIESIKKLLYENYLNIKAENENESIEKSKYIKIKNDEYVGNDEVNGEQILLTLNISKNFVLISLFRENDIIKKHKYNIHSDIVSDINKRKNSNSKFRLNEILNEDISNYSGPLKVYHLENNIEHSEIYFTDDNNSYKTFNMFDSHSIMTKHKIKTKDDKFDINLSNIQIKFDDKFNYEQNKINEIPEFKLDSKEELITNKNLNDRKQ